MPNLPLMMEPRLDARTLLRAYASGVFPMTDPDGVTRWYTADPRGVLPLDGFHCPKTLNRVVRQSRFEIAVDRDFVGVMRACKEVPRPETSGGWISDELIAAYADLHQLGFGHSIEAYQDNQLVGGLYGVAIGGAFFGESMFHHVANASKVALVHLVQRLRDRGYALLDTQMVTDHMKQFGCIHIDADDYMTRLEAAICLQCSFV